MKGKLIQSREQFITICSRVGVKDSACTSLLETKNPLQIPNGARGPYIGGIQDCLLYHGVVKSFPLFQRKKSLNLTQHGNSLTELITEFLSGHQKRVADQLWHVKVCELTCLSSVVFNLTCNWHSFLDQFTGSEHRFGLLQSLNDYTMNIHIDGVPINQSNQSKSLGLIIDEKLSWKAHIHEISKKLSSGIGALKQVRPFVSMHTAITLQLLQRCVGWLDPTA